MIRPTLTGAGAHVGHVQWYVSGAQTSILCPKHRPPGLPTKRGQHRLVVVSSLGGSVSATLDDPAHAYTREPIESLTNGILHQVQQPGANEDAAPAIAWRTVIADDAPAFEVRFASAHNCPTITVYEFEGV